MKNRFHKNTSPREKQMRFRNAMKKVGIALGVCYLVGAWAFCSEMDYRVAMAEKNAEPMEHIATTETKYTTEIKTANDNTRTASAVLVDIDENGNYILQTEDGHLWSISDAPEVCYELTFATKGTIDLTDDEIIGLE